MAANALASNKQIVVGKTFALKKKIGEGSFGKIFLCWKKDIIPEELYAIKLITDKNMWQNELSIYQKLQGKIQGVQHIPFIHDSGSEGKFHYIVMDLLEQNLEELCREKECLPLNVVLHLGLQMLLIIEAIHERGIIHRDIKPSNFLLKTNPANGISELYLIDFGLSVSEDHSVRQDAVRQIIGTTRYMSVAVQQGGLAGRRDDLESLGYILIFLQKGSLPWQNAPKDMSLPIKQTFDWAYNKLICGEFILFINYCKTLAFAQRPNYEYLKGLITNLLSNL